MIRFGLGVATIGLDIVAPPLGSLLPSIRDRDNGDDEAAVAVVPLSLPYRSLLANEFKSPRSGEFFDRGSLEDVGCIGVGIWSFFGEEGRRAMGFFFSGLVGAKKNAERGER